jgi:hypothetical protein
MSSAFAPVVGSTGTLTGNSLSDNFKCYLPPPVTGFSDKMLHMNLKRMAGLSAAMSSYVYVPQIARASLKVWKGGSTGLGG